MRGTPGRQPGCAAFCRPAAEKASPPGSWWIAGPWRRKRQAFESDWTAGIQRYAATFSVNTCCTTADGPKRSHCTARHVRHSQPAGLAPTSGCPSGSVTVCELSRARRPDPQTHPWRQQNHDVTSAKAQAVHGHVSCTPTPALRIRARTRIHSGRDADSRGNHLIADSHPVALPSGRQSHSQKKPLSIQSPPDRHGLAHVPQ